MTGPAGPPKFFETFCMGVGKILGLGGSKYRLGVGRQAGRDPEVPVQSPPGVGKKKPDGFIPIYYIA